MMVIDASAAIGMVLAGGDGDASARLLADCEKTIAPEFFCEEAAQVAWKFAHIGKLDEEGALEMMRSTVNCVGEFWGNESLAIEALSEAVRFDHSFYDMLYFVLARRTASPLLTCDHRLAKLCSDNDVECIMLMDVA